MTLDDLLSALEAATEGSERFDVAIAHIIGAAKQSYNEDGVTDDIVYDPPYRSGQPRCRPLSYTRSIDAAMTLIPGVWWRVGKVQDLHSPLRAFGHGKSYTAEIGLNWGDAPVLGHADTAALALVIAALRARKAQP